MRYGFSLPVASLFAILNWADFAPWLVGLNVIVYVVLPPASIVADVELSLTVNSEALVPLIATFGVPDKVKLAVPKLSMVNVVFAELVPETWLPKPNVPPEE